MDARLAELTTFGLTEPQVAAYVYLLNREMATAAEVATGAGIPRNRAYEILDGLAALGLVQVVSGTKRNFKALPVGPFLGRKISEAQVELDRLKERAPAIERELIPTAESQGFLGAFATWRGPSSVANAAKRLFLEARENVRIIATPVAVHRWIVPILGDVIEARRAEGLDVRLLVTNCDAAKFDPLLDVPFRAMRGGGSVTKLVIDGRTLLIRGTDGRKDDEAYEWRHEGLSLEASSYFDHLWACPASSPTAQDVLRVPREGEGANAVRTPDTPKSGFPPTSGRA